MPGTNHWSAEPSSTSGSSGANSAEEDQRLHHREQDRGRLAEHRLELADHHVPGVGDDSGRLELRRRARTARLADSHVLGVRRHAATPSLSVALSLLRLRPVRSRKHVVEGRPDDLDPLDGRALPGQVGHQARGQVPPVRDPQRDLGALQVDDGTRDRHGALGADGGVRDRPEAEPDQVAERRLEPGRRVVGDDHAVVDDDHPVGDGVRLLEVVRRQHDRRALLRVQPGDLLLEVDPVLRVEARRRLVEEEDPRRVHQTDRDVEPSALAARQGRDRPHRLLGEVERRDELVGALVGLTPAHPERPGLADQLVAPALGVAGRVALADVADRAPHVAVLAHHVVPGDLGGAGGRWQEGGEHPQGRRLPGTVGSEERDELALGDLQIEAADGLHGGLVTGEVAGQPARSNHWSGHRKSLASI